MLTRLIVSALAVLIAAYTLDGVTVTPWWWAFVIAIVLGFINAFIKPVVKLLALPINMLTLGLFTFIINGLMVLLCAWLLARRRQPGLGNRIQHRSHDSELDS